MRGAAGRVNHMLSMPRISAAAILDLIREVVRTLERDPGLTSRELAERMRLGRRQVSLLLLRLEEHGHVVHDGRRWFAAPVERP